MTTRPTKSMAGTIASGWRGQAAPCTWLRHHAVTVTGSARMKPRGTAARAKESTAATTARRLRW